ncbi:MAG: replicative DNA helicase [Candidatus Margulisiibacteriota bacterium]
MAEDRLPPQDLNAEQSVVGCMLLDKNAIIRVVEMLRPDSFYRDAHRYIFEAILNLFDKNEPVDIVTVTAELRKTDRLDSVGGSVYISDLLNCVPTAANVEYYAKIVAEKAVLRRLIEAGTKIVAEAFEDPENVDAVLDDAEKSIFEIALKRSRQGFQKIDALLKSVLNKIDQLYGKKESLIGIPTGYPDLDSMTGGLQNSELIIIAARPSVGKTALALNIAQNVAVKHKLPVAIFSLEMSKEALAQRLLCSESEVDAQKLRAQTLSDAGWKRLTRAIGRLSEASIWIDDTAAISATEIRAKARRMKIERGLSLVIIDYMQLIQARFRSENRVQEMSEIARALKTMARELDVPVIALSQLSRAVEQRQVRIPRLSDLRESGEIEQTADLVLFIHRDDYNNPNSEKANTAEIIIAKQRNGPTGSVDLVFRKEYTKFESKSQYNDAA